MAATANVPADAAQRTPTNNRSSGKSASADVPITAQAVSTIPACGKYVNGTFVGLMNSNTANTTGAWKPATTTAGTVELPS